MGSDLMWEFERHAKDMGPLKEKLRDAARALARRDDDAAMDELVNAVVSASNNLEEAERRWNLAMSGK